VAFEALNFDAGPMAILVIFHGELTYFQ